MSYIDEIWAKVPERWRPTFEIMQQALRNPAVEAVMDLAVLTPSGEVIPCDFATTVLWRQQNPHLWQVKRTEAGLIGDRPVVVCSSFIEVGLPLMEGLKLESVHFETQVQGTHLGDWSERSRTYAETLETHERLVGEARAYLRDVELL